jgi:hypothetical protein
MIKNPIAKDFGPGRAASLIRTTQGRSSRILKENPANFPLQLTGTLN